MAKSAKTTVAIAQQEISTKLPRKAPANRDGRPTVDYMAQNMFSYVLGGLFIATNPAGNEERFPGLNEAIGKVVEIALRDKEVFSKVSGSGHFQLTENNWEVTPQGQSLAMHRFQAMQSDKYRTLALDYFFGTPSETEVRRPLGKIREIWEDIVTAGSEYLRDEWNNLTEEERMSVVDAFNAAQQNVVSAATPVVDETAE